MIAGFWASNAMATTDKAAQAKKQRQRMKVVIKMFFVMGLSWIADIVSWAVQEGHGDYEFYKKTGLRYTSLAFAIINSCQVSFFFFLSYKKFYAWKFLFQFRA